MPHEVMLKVKLDDFLMTRSVTSVQQPTSRNEVLIFLTPTPLCVRECTYACPQVNEFVTASVPVRRRRRRPLPEVMPIFCLFEQAGSRATPEEGDPNLPTIARRDTRNIRATGLLNVIVAITFASPPPPISGVRYAIIAGAYLTSIPRCTRLSWLANNGPPTWMFVCNVDLIKNIT